MSEIQIVKNFIKEKNSFCKNNKEIYDYFYEKILSIYKERFYYVGAHLDNTLNLLNKCLDNDSSEEIVFFVFDVLKDNLFKEIEKKENISEEYFSQLKKIKLKYSTNNEICNIIDSILQH